MKQGAPTLILYVLLGACLVAAFVVTAFLVPLHYLTELNRGWFFCCFFTLVLVIFVIRMYWSARRSHNLWRLLFLLFVGHAAFYAVIFRELGQLPTLWYLLTMPLEVMLIATIVYLCLKIPPPRVKM